MPSLSPRDHAHAWWELARVIAPFVAGRYEEQVENARRMTETAPDHPAGWRFLASGLGHVGRVEEAKGAVERFVELVPYASIAFVRATIPAARSEDLERFLDGLRKAGLPE